MLPVDVEDVEARCSVVLPLWLNIPQFAHAYFKRKRAKGRMHPITEKMFTERCLMVLPHLKFCLCPHIEQGDQRSVNVQCKGPVVLPGLTRSSLNCWTNRVKSTHFMKTSFMLGRKYASIQFTERSFWFTILREPWLLRANHHFFECIFSQFYGLRNISGDPSTGLFAAHQKVASFRILRH